MNPCQETSPAIETITDISQVPVIELDETYHEKLPIETRIGLCLMDEGGLLQHTGFALSDRNALPTTIATKLGLDSADEEIIECVRSGIKTLFDNDYLDFHRIELPIMTEFRDEQKEVWELHLQPVVTPKFEDILRGSFDTAWKEFSSDKN